MKSKFIEALKKQSQTSAPPIGFGRRKEEAKSPVSLIASLDAAPDRKFLEIAPALDAVILIGTKISKEALKNSIKSHPFPWGLRLKSRRDLTGMEEAGLDFFVLPYHGTEAAVLRIEDPGKVMEIVLDLSDSQLSALEFLPIDALLLPYSGKGNSLALDELMAYKRVDILVTKPLLGYVPAKISSEDLRLLWEVGLDGIIIKGEELTREEADSFKETMKSFPSHRGEKRQPAALVPSLASTIPGAAEDEPEQDQAKIANSHSNHFPSPGNNSYLLSPLC